MTIQNLFATPVALYNIKDDFADFEKTNGRMIEVFPQRENGANLFNFKDRPDFNQLRIIIKRRLIQYTYEAELDDDLIFFDGFFNDYKPGDLNTPHAHPLAKVVAVYYARALGKGHGDILVHDPRGAVSWHDITDVDSRGVNGSRVYKSFTPVTGDLLIFPAYVVHSVQPNQLTDQPTRISIGINCYSRPFLRLFNSNL